MKPRRLTFAACAGQELAPAELRKLLVTGTQRAAQEQRLRHASVLIRDEHRVVAAAVCSRHGEDLRVDELGIITRGAHDELADQVIDMFETAAIAGGFSRLVLCSTAGELRRALRLLGYIPQTQARRLCFFRRMNTVDHSGGEVTSDNGRATRES